MKSERDLVAEWAGEELLAAVRAPSDERSTHFARGQFYIAILKGGLDGCAWLHAACEDGAHPRYF